MTATEIYQSPSISPYGATSQAKKPGVTRDAWKPPSAQDVRDKWQKCQDDMLDIRRNFMLNSSFYHGDQWLKWDDELATVNILNFMSDQEGQARATVNKLKPRMTSLEARLCKTPLTFEPRPDGVDAYALQMARLQRQILDVKSHRDGWMKIRRDNIHDALLGGVAGICTEPAYQYDDPPISDGEGEMIKVPSRPAPKISNLCGVEFGLEPGTVDEKDALWWIRNTTLTPEQAQKRYHLETLPEADAEAAQGAMQRALRSNRRGSTNAKGTAVLVYYEKPTDDSPGVVVHVVGHRIVEQSKWPFPFNDLNITTFVEAEISGTWKGDTRMNDARQIQMQINRAYTSIQANINRCDNNRMLMPNGAVIDGEDEVTGMPGEIIRYDPEAGAPSWLQPPDIASRGMRELIEKLEGELDDLFSTHAVSRGEAVGDRNSGLALSILAEKDETPLGLIAEDQQRGWQRVAEQVLMLERHLMLNVEQATGQPMQVTDVLMSSQDNPRSEPKEVSWSAQDIPEHPVIHIPLDAVMPRSQAAVQDMMMKIASNPAFAHMFQALSAHQLGTILQLPDATAFASTADEHVEEANWENARMIAGADEQTVMVQMWQPHAVHIDIHNRGRAGAGYRDADQETKQFYDLHVQAHETLLQEDLMRQQQEQAQQTASQPGGPGSPPVPGPPPSQ